MDNHSPTRHARHVLPLRQVFHNGICVYELGRAPQVEIVRFLAPARHWAPSWDFDVERARLIWQIADSIGNNIQLSVLVKAPNLNLEFRPKSSH